MKTTYLLAITLDTERPDDEGGEATALGALLAGLDDAYNHGRLPSDMSWYTPILAQLPDGWQQARAGAFKAVDDGPVLEVRFRDSEVAVVGAHSAPAQAVAAVLARFAGGCEP